MKRNLFNVSVSGLALDNSLIRSKPILILWVPGTKKILVRNKVDGFPRNASQNDKLLSLS